MMGVGKFQSNMTGKVLTLLTSIVVLDSQSLQHSSTKTNRIQSGLMSLLLPPEFLTLISFPSIVILETLIARYQDIPRY